MGEGLGSFLSLIGLNLHPKSRQLRKWGSCVLQSEAENEIYAGFLVSFSNQKPGMKFTPALFGFPFS